MNPGIPRGSGFGNFKNCLLRILLTYVHVYKWWEQKNHAEAQLFNPHRKFFNLHFSFQFQAISMVLPPFLKIVFIYGNLKCVLID